MQPVFIKPFSIGTNLRKRQLIQGPYATSVGLRAVYEGVKTTKNLCWTGDLNANCDVDFVQQLGVGALGLGWYPALQ